MTRKSPRDYLFNSNDQLNLYSSSSLTNVSRIQWKIFPRLTNSSYLVGVSEKNLTIGREVFAEYSSVVHWRFQVIYSFVETKEKLFNELLVEMNVCPANGSCSISPSTGDLFTQFEIHCSGWFDEDEIKDYVLISRSSSANNGDDDRSVLSSSRNGSFRTVLPATRSRSEELFDSVMFRNEFHCSTEYVPRPSVKIFAEVSAISRFLDLSRSMMDDPSFTHSSLQLIDQLDEEFLYHMSWNSSLAHFTVAALNYHPPRTLVCDSCVIGERDCDLLVSELESVDDRS